MFPLVKCSALVHWDGVCRARVWSKDEDSILTKYGNKFTTHCRGNKLLKMSQVNILKGCSRNYHNLINQLYFNKTKKYFYKGKKNWIINVGISPKWKIL